MVDTAAICTALGGKWYDGSEYKTSTYTTSQNEDEAPMNRAIGWTDWISEAIVDRDARGAVAGSYSVSVGGNRIAAANSLDITMNAVKEIAIHYRAKVDLDKSYSVVSGYFINAGEKYYTYRSVSDYTVLGEWYYIFKVVKGCVVS